MLRPQLDHIDPGDHSPLLVSALASDDVTEEEDELIESARADEARFRAFRCFFVIEAFSAGQKVCVGERERERELPRG